MKVYDTIIIGGGQAGLSVGYFLRRSNLDYLILDNQSKAGGSWLQTWDSLKLFSPTDYSSLSGWAMPKSENEYPTKKEFINYLEKYESRYAFPINRNVLVKNIIKEGELFKIESNSGIFYSKTLVSATGTAKSPFIPSYPNQEKFKGVQLHSAFYKNSSIFKDKKVIIVGEGNSGAQVLAEVSKVANTKWVTLNQPHFLPDDIDGRYLFHEANQKFFNSDSEDKKTEVSLSSVVMVDSVKDARSRNVLQSVRPFKSFYEDGVIWADNTKEKFDVVIWCTGFKANLKHLAPLNITVNSQIETLNTRSVKEPKLWLVGYGNWTGFASATIYGVGKTARQTAREITETLSKNDE